MNHWVWECHRRGSQKVPRDNCMSDVLRPFVFKHATLNHNGCALFGSVSMQLVMKLQEPDLGFIHTTVFV